MKLIPTLGADTKTLEEIFLRGVPASIMALIGPEGDFSAAEVNAAISAGFIPVSLGDLVLRVDTAAIAIASYIRLKTL